MTDIRDDITVLRSGRKSVGLEIKADGRILLRAPLAMTERQIDRFLRDKQPWLERQLERLRQQQAAHAGEPKLTPADIHRLRAEAAAVLPSRAEHFAQILGVNYGRIAIRHQKTRWGSCSSKGNLNLNCLLMLMPGEIADYILVHELCHCREMNHSPAFWSLVASVLPDYKERKKWLNQYGNAIMARNRE